MFLTSLAADLGITALYYYLHTNKGFMPSFDIARFTTVAVVMTAFVAGLICYFRHKKKDDVYGAVFLSTLISFAGSFIGSISGAVLAANMIK